MCDYSLHYVANRPAKVGDKLVTTRFREIQHARSGNQRAQRCGVPASWN